jgi:hypothetical protein
MRFTYYTIIGKDPKMLQGHLNNVKSYAGFDRLECEKELIVIVYRNKKIPKEVTENIVDICNKENVTVVYYDEPHDRFLENLYNSWNLGYEASKDGFVFRGGSDQVFNKDGFISLHNVAMEEKSKNNKIVLQAQTIEDKTVCNQQKYVSRHFMEDFGSTFDTFNYVKFEEFCNRINRGVDKKVLTIDECLSLWGKPTILKTQLGKINRVDGCSWLMTKEEWLKYGPLPAIERNITGDVVIHDRMQRDGYIEYLVKDCITYHFVRGERRQ